MNTLESITWIYRIAGIFQEVKNFIDVTISLLFANI